MGLRKARAAAMVGLTAKSSGEQERKALLEYMSEHPWNWLSATDVDGTPIVWTKDEREGRFRPYPAEKLYLKELVDTFIDPKHKIDIVEKTRQMLLTTTILLISLWEILQSEAQRVLLSKITEDESIELFRDKVRAPWSKMPEWLKEEWPITMKPAGVVEAKKTRSVMLALAENSADREIRGGGASRLIVDEAAFQQNTPNMVSSAIPMAKKITLITTPMSGTRGGLYIQALMADEEWKD